MTMCADDDAYSNREKKPFNEQAALLVENCLDLIKQVLVKHTAAVLEEMHDQIVSRNEQIKRLATEIDKANTKGHQAVKLAMDVEDRERRLASQLIRAEKERDIVVGVLTQVRCYIDSPRFDEEGEVIEMVDDILKRMA